MHVSAHEPPRVATASTRGRRLLVAAAKKPRFAIKERFALRVALRGMAVCVDAQPAITVLELKRRVARAAETAPAALRFVLFGTTLLDAQTLAECNITAASCAESRHLNADLFAYDFVGARSAAAVKT